MTHWGLSRQNQNKETNFLDAWLAFNFLHVSLTCSHSSRQLAFNKQNLKLADDKWLLTLRLDLKSTQSTHQLTTHSHHRTMQLLGKTPHFMFSDSAMVLGGGGGLSITNIIQLSELPLQIHVVLVLHPTSFTSFF